MRVTQTQTQTCNALCFEPTVRRTVAFSSSPKGCSSAKSSMSVLRTTNPLLRQTGRVPPFLLVFPLLLLQLAHLLAHLLARLLALFDPPHRGVCRLESATQTQACDLPKQGAFPCRRARGTGVRMGGSEQSPNERSGPMSKERTNVRPVWLAVGTEAGRTYLGLLEAGFCLL